MPRPSDLFKNTGTGGPKPAPQKNTFNLTPEEAPPAGSQGDPDHVTGTRPNKGGPTNIVAGGKAQGGAGGPSGRPKV